MNQIGDALYSGYSNDTAKRLTAFYYFWQEGCSL